MVPRMLISGLLPGDGMSLWHGQPRDGKSLASLELAMAITTATPAFGLEHLKVSEPAPVLYVTEEDPRHRVAERLQLLMAGRGIQAAPERLALSVGRGLSVDDPATRQRLIAAVRDGSYKLVILDPLRSLTTQCDKGPADLMPLAHFLRDLIRQTGCALLIVHHDTKPQPGIGDARRSPHRASGGGIFSIADAPVSVTRLKDGSVQVKPCSYKFGTDSEPFCFTIETDRGLRLVGRPLTAAEAVDTVGAGNSEAELDEEVYALLVQEPGLSGSVVAVKLRKSKQRALDSIRRLQAAGRIGKGNRPIAPAHPKEWDGEDGLDAFGPA
jgi:hypothetical protein